MKSPEQVFLSRPAFPVMGLDVWKVTGIKCAKKLEKSMAMEKIENCRTCAFCITCAHTF